MLRIIGKNKTIRSCSTACAVLLFVALTGTAAADVPFFNGTIRDTLGNGLPGVEVLILSPGKAVAPLAASRSDREGVFGFPELLPGPYRIAALKEGYLTFVGQVNTTLQKSFDLVLHPSLDVENGQAIPHDSSWALRLPRRSILRETEAGAVEEIDTLDWPRPEADARLELDQLISAAAPVADLGSEPTEMTASATRMSYTSPLGERGSLLVHGHRARYESNNSAESSASQRDAGMRFDLEYETSPSSQLDFNAFYRESDFAVNAAIPERSNSVQERHATWGYDASWSQRIDENSRVGIRVDYQDTWLEFAGRRGSADEPLVSPGLANRSIGAEASFERQGGQRHHLLVALRARLLQWPTDGLLGQTQFDLLEDDRSGLNVELETRDNWAVSIPVRLIYGVAYQHSLADSDLRVVVPRFGGEFASSGGWNLRAELAYHSVNYDPIATETPASKRRRSELGYDAEMEIPIAEGIKLRGSSRQEPVHFGHLGYGGGSDGMAEPLYISNGSASVHENSLTLLQKNGGSQTYVELSSGSAKGTLATFVPFGRSEMLLDRSLDFNNARVGVRLPTSGTDLMLEYKQVIASAAHDREGGSDSELRSLQMQFRKDLWGLTSIGDWRFLLAMSLGSVETTDLEAWREQGGDEAALNALNRRISAGVSVAF